MPPKKIIPIAASAPVETLIPPPPPSPLIQLLRKDWRWAGISQFLWTFSDAFGLVDWDIENLEADIDGDETQVIPDIIAKMLYALTYNRQINRDNAMENLRKQYIKRMLPSPLGSEEEPKEWATLGLGQKVQMLWDLCEWQMLDPARFRALLKSEDEATSWRIDPVGWDKDGNTYFLFDDNRLWIRRLPPAPPRPPKKTSLKAKKAALAAKKSQPKSSTSTPGPSNSAPSARMKKRKRDLSPELTPPPPIVPMLEEDPILSGTRRRTQVSFYGNVTPTVKALRRGNGTGDSGSKGSESKITRSTSHGELAKPFESPSRASRSRLEKIDYPAGAIGSRPSRAGTGGKAVDVKDPKLPKSVKSREERGNGEPPKKRGRGRPRKTKVEDEVEESDLSELTDEDEHEAKLNKVRLSQSPVSTKMLKETRIGKGKEKASMEVDVNGIGGDDEDGLDTPLTPISSRQSSPLSEDEGLDDETVNKQNDGLGSDNKLEDVLENGDPSNKVETQNAGASANVAKADTEVAGEDVQGNKDSTLIGEMGGEIQSPQNVHAASSEVDKGEPISVALETSESAKVNEADSDVEVENKGNEVSVDQPSSGKRLDDDIDMDKKEITKTEETILDGQDGHEGAEKSEDAKPEETAAEQPKPNVKVEEIDEDDDVKVAVRDANNLPEGFIEWEAVCVTLYDWRTFPERFANSRDPDEKNFYQLLKFEVGPKIIEVLVAKEQERIKQEAINNRKRSSRIATKELEKEEILRRQKATQEMEGRMERMRAEEARKIKEEADLQARERERENRLKEREERMAAREEAVIQKALEEQRLKEKREKRRERRQRRRDGEVGVESSSDEDENREGSAKAAGGGHGKKGEKGGSRVGTPLSNSVVAPRKAQAKTADGWELNCEICRKSGWNLDGEDDLVSCDDCGRWQHVDCHDRQDASEGKPRRNWDKVDFKCKECKRKAARKRQRQSDEARMRQNGQSSSPNGLPSQISNGQPSMYPQHPSSGQYPPNPVMLRIPSQPQINGAQHLYAHRPPAGSQHQSAPPPVFHMHPHVGQPSSQSPNQSSQQYPAQRPVQASYPSQQPAFPHGHQDISQISSHGHSAYPSGPPPNQQSPAMRSHQMPPGYRPHPPHPMQSGQSYPGHRAQQLPPGLSPRAQYSFHPQAPPSQNAPRPMPSQSQPQYSQSLYPSGQQPDAQLHPQHQSHSRPPHPPTMQNGVGQHLPQEQYTQQAIYQPEYGQSVPHSSAHPFAPQRPVALPYQQPQQNYSPVRPPPSNGSRHPGSLDQQQQASQRMSYNARPHPGDGIMQQSPHRAATQNGPAPVPRSHPPPSNQLKAAESQPNVNRGAAPQGRTNISSDELQTARESSAKTPQPLGTPLQRPPQSSHSTPPPAASISHNQPEKLGDVTPAKAPTVIDPSVPVSALLQSKVTAASNSTGQAE